MATLEFTEYLYAPLRYGTAAPLPQGQEVTTQQVEIGAASAASEAFNARTQLIVISAVGADCRIAIGSDPTADNAEPGMTRLLTEGREYAFDVAAGEKLAVIEVAA